MDYLDIISPDQGVVVFDQWIPRARLGLHLRLAKILERVTYKDVKETAQAVIEYLILAGADVAELTGSQRLRVLLILSELNRLQSLLPFLEWRGAETKEPPYTYPGRAWALWIHKLATRYGWNRDDIFNLWPEEATVYIQEIILSEYDEADERRALSEMGYSYDKATQKSRFIPLPRPGWMLDRREPPKIIRVRKDMLPIGNIIKLNDLTKNDFKIH